MANSFTSRKRNSRRALHGEDGSPLKTEEGMLKQAHEDNRKRGALTALSPHPMNCPPFTSITCPVMYPDSVALDRNR